MEDRSELIIWLVIWVVVFAFTLLSQWNQKLPSSGLPLAYILSLSMIHFFGGLIYAFPWYTPKSAYLLQAGGTYTQVLEGFIQSLYGILGFSVGSTILTYWLLHLWQPHWLWGNPQEPDLQLPRGLFAVSLLFFLIVTPAIGRIPGFQGFSTSGVYLFVVSLCLSCWSNLQQKNVRGFFGWLAVSFSLPVVTIFTLGFIGYGASATLAVLIFISSFYRPRWQVLVAGILAFVFGLSVYVTYMRDRSEIRTSVWGGESSQSRLEKITKTFSNFEIISPFNQSHLEAIDIRLNQNVLVGKGVEYIRSGQQNFALGATILQGLLAPIPRILWRDKFTFGGSGNIVSLYTGQKFGYGTSVGVGQVLEFYINFGSIGVFIGFLILGVIIRIVDILASHNLFSGNWLGFVFWFLPGLVAIQPGGALAEITASMASSLVLMIIIRRLLGKKSSGTRVLNSMTQE